MRLIAFVQGTSKDTMSVLEKVARRLLPYLMIIYVINFLDRINIGFAKAQMAPAIGLTDSAYGLGAGIFFIVYTALVLPSRLLLNSLGARTFIASIILVWGVVSTAMMFVSSPSMFITLRILLGAAEAGFFPSVILYLAVWFPSPVRSQALAMFSLGIYFAGAVGAPISGLILSQMHEVFGLAGWRWMFLMEGLPAIILGVATFFYLNNTPEESQWLSDAERAVLTSELRKDLTDATQPASSGKAEGSQFDAACLIVANFGILVAAYAISFWMPQVIRNFGVSNYLYNGLLAAVPFIVGGVSAVLGSRRSDRTGERRWHCVIGATTCAIGLVMIGAFATDPFVSFAGLLLTMASAGAIGAVMFAIPSMSFPLRKAGIVIGLMTMSGNLAGYVSPVMIGMIGDRFGNISYGFLAASGFVFASALMLLIMPWLRVHQRVLRNLRPAGVSSFVDKTSSAKGAIS